MSAALLTTLGTLLLTGADTTPQPDRPNRDVGAQLPGAFAADRIQVALGAFNGGADASNLDGDANDDKVLGKNDFAGTPF